jgi:nickel/cobalt exporter
MITLITGSIALSLLHALIPNHWLPVLAIGKRENWTISKTTYVTAVAGLSHALSTVVIGIVLGILGLQLADKVAHFTHFIAPSILVALGLFYIIQHHRHKHLHLHADHRAISSRKAILTLAVAMFFSPCLEVEAYFLMAGTKGFWLVLLIGMIYTFVSVMGMVVWVRLGYTGLTRLNWHSIEHNSGIITGITLIVTGILSYFIS